MTVTVPWGILGKMVVTVRMVQTVRQGRPVKCPRRVGGRLVAKEKKESQENLVGAVVGAVAGKIREKMASQEAGVVGELAVVVVGVVKEECPGERVLAFYLLGQT
jgi:hypothetical protein